MSLVTEDQRFQLDVDAFPAFCALLEACKEYAAITGGRFSISDFRCKDSEKSQSNSDERGAVCLACRDTVLAFEVALTEAQAATATPSDMIQEVQEAYRLCMSESVRNGMKATFSQLRLWPPSPELLGGAIIDENDCAYQDMSKPLPVIAQQCFNDERHRMRGPFSTEFHRRTLTASFLLDFAVASGMRLTSMPDTQRVMLEEFARLVEEWTKGQGAATSHARTAFLNGLGVNPAAAVARIKVTEWWKDNWQSVAWTTAAVGVIALGVAMMTKRKR
jgi:hypothetical protein